MAVELSYVLITPYTILKSRTGGVIARLLSRTDLELVGAQMLNPTKELAENYAGILKKTVSTKAADLLSDYVLNNFTPNEDGTRRRILMLLFKGDNACSKLYSIAGRLSPESRGAGEMRITGETVRDTYADLVFDRDGSLRYFEPAVLLPPDQEFAMEKLKLFANFADSHPNMIDMNYDDKTDVERTLVIIKPDNWRYPSSKPGNIIDMFSRTGLRIIATKIYQMTVSEALEFYGPVQGVLREKLAPKIGDKAKALLETELKLKLDDKASSRLSEIVGVPFADDQFSQIVEFMSGIRPDTCPKNKLHEPGLVKTMVLVYEGKKAVKKIRDVLGPTDPTKAPSGTIRREFGQDVMVNTAHASDSAENAVREMKIIRIQENNLSRIIKDFLAEKGYK
ncbi:MAG TPA: nucleoside-diphosphate kinase [Lentisphaeria bacterium]|nr:MAG: nucleoside-diphosphate kinase [Lentisphaerae bacterium GWF2_50_93]HCE46302.1 nucleoside-diphosphate kinase [Lentisphaeria bacterium]